ncbi:MAG TPA: hypothetical protein VMD76_11720, partial [Candidatus Sulfotelmatobacter sp.]|nr:hypothetical protein [Candidatus Sulfotelmatobacter sp.]
MDDRLPLPALLSFALVAFTIEFDNEAERQIPHYTTRRGSTSQEPAKSEPAGSDFRKPWLVSMAMYLNCMQFLDEKGMPARELVRRARARTNFRGMHRWGYISMRPPSEGGAKAAKSEWIVRPNAAGRIAQQIWKPLLHEMEDRWSERFGNRQIVQMRKALAAIEGQFGLDLPDCMPILGYGLFSKGKKYKDKPAGSHDAPERRLPVLLARALLAFAIDFESASKLSLAMSANVVRILDKEGVRVRDLPVLSGVSREAVAVSLSFLSKNGYATLTTELSRSRARVARLAEKGIRAQAAYHQLL